MPGPERRVHRRVPLNLLIQYRFDSFEEFVAEYASDISLGGMFIRTKDVRPVGAHVYLQFVLKDGRRLIEGLGAVVRSVPDGPEPGMGVSFVNFDADSMELIAKIIGELPGHGDGESQGGTPDG